VIAALECFGPYRGGKNLQFGLEFADEHIENLSVHHCQELGRWPPQNDVTFADGRCPPPLEQARPCIDLGQRSSLIKVKNGLGSEFALLVTPQ
jgi:hypothetical protein